MDQLNHSPNESLAKALALINAPFCLIALIGLPFLLYILGNQTLSGEILKFRSFFVYVFWLFIIGYGLYLEYGYYQIGFKPYQPDREKALWIHSAIFNGLVFIYWVAYYFLLKINQVKELLDGLLILLFLMTTLVYFWYSFKAFKRLDMPPIP
ncbi:MAG: hypothetical protein ACKOW2_08635 [Sphingobacteriaceae bacterium]